MRLVNTVLGILIILVPVTIAGLILGWALPGAESWADLLNTLGQHREAALKLSVAAILLVLAFVWTGLRKDRNNQLLTFDGNGGSVGISLTAVSDFIGRIGEEFSAVISLKPSVLIIDNELDVGVDLRVKGGTQIPELCQVLQDRIRESISENLGFSEVKNIRVTVREIAGVGKPKGRRSEGQ